MISSLRFLTFLRSTSTEQIYKTRKPLSQSNVTSQNDIGHISFVKKNCAVNCSSLSYLKRAVNVSHDETKEVTI